MVGLGEDDRHLSGMVDLRNESLVMLSLNYMLGLNKTAKTSVS